MQPIPPSDRVRQVEAALSDYVERAGLKAGDRLPAERELMAALGVGRSTIREVIRKFQALGVIDSRKGSGNYLLKPISAATVHMPISIDAESLRDALLMTLEVRHRSGRVHGGGAPPHGGRYCHDGSAAR
jgi:GntR family transcriptional repressor for pyruvate dehydrogenase complex